VWGLQHSSITILVSRVSSAPSFSEWECLNLWEGNRCGALCH